MLELLGTLVNFVGTTDLRIFHRRSVCRHPAPKFKHDPLIDEDNGITMALKKIDPRPAKNPGRAEAGDVPRPLFFLGLFLPMGAPILTA